MSLAEASAYNRVMSRVACLSLLALACGEVARYPGGGGGAGGAGGAGAGGGGGTAPSPTAAAALMRTLEELAAFGQKRVGTPGGKQAQDYLVARFRELGLEDVHTEDFQFPRHDVEAATVLLKTGFSPPAPVGFDVFEGSGGGDVEAAVVFVGAAVGGLGGVDVRDKIALVQRNPSLHRSTQYENVARAGALAMLYISQAPDNLRQVGSVRRAWEAVGPIPAITIGSEDGEAVMRALAMNLPVSAHIQTRVVGTPASGGNVVGRIRGREGNRGQLVLGAHFDTWFVGSVDNTSGVAALLALAELRARKGERPRYDLVFVAWDGEEVGLYGGYSFVRQHTVVTPEPVLAILNFEMPSSKDASLQALGHSNTPVLERALEDALLNRTYSFYVGLEVVPSFFGGIIPTDIQGAYRVGIPTASTVVDTAYYHTTADTPDKVDLAVLAEAAERFEKALDELDAAEPAAFTVRDPKLWQLELALSPGGGFDVVARDSTGKPQPSATVGLTVFYDHYFPAGAVTATSGADGKAHLGLDPAWLRMGTGHRFAHLWAGTDYPLVEAIVSVGQ